MSVNFEQLVLLRFASQELNSRHVCFSRVAVVNGFNNISETFARIGSKDAMTLVALQKTDCFIDRKRLFPQNFVLGDNLLLNVSFRS